jgi:uncharacterized protein (TIGR03435 family)
MNLRAFLLITLPALWTASAQTAGDQQITFEAASVKVIDLQATPGDLRMAAMRMRRQQGGPGTDDPGRLHYLLPLSALIARAFEVQADQVQGLPWTSNPLLEINAAVAPGASVHDAHLMLRNLLVERFQMKYRVETKPVNGFALLSVKKGALVSPVSTEHARPVTTAAMMYTPDGHAIPQLIGKPGIRSVHEVRGWAVVFEQQTMAQFAAYLGERFATPVQDLTGIGGKVDFSLQFYPPEWSLPSGEDGVKYFPPLRSVMRSKLGLRLQSKKQPGPLIVIEHIEPLPTEN